MLLSSFTFLLLGGLVTADISLDVENSRLAKPIKKCDETFCFDLTLVLRLTGIRDISPNIADHYSCVGFDTDRVIVEGSNAIQFFMDTYSVDYTFLANAQLLDQGTVSGPGDTEFSPVVYDTEEQLRLLFASTTFNFDAPHVAVKWAAWEVHFLSDFTSTGSFSGTIPADSFVFFGSFIIELCPYRSRYCPSFLRSKFQYKPLFIQFKSIDFSREEGPAGGRFTAFNWDADLEQKDGLARGVIYNPGPRSDGKNVFDGSFLIKFPGLTPLENPFPVREDRFECDSGRKSVH